MGQGKTLCAAALAQGHEGVVAKHLADAGTVAAVMPAATSAGEDVYLVRMDGDEVALYPAFYADELELEP